MADAKKPTPAEQKAADDKKAQDAAVAAKQADDKRIAEQKAQADKAAPKVEGSAASVAAAHEATKEAAKHEIAEQAEHTKDPGLVATLTTDPSKVLDSDPPIAQPEPGEFDNRKFKHLRTGPFDALLDFVPTANVGERLFVTLDHNGQPKGLQRKQPDIGVPYVRVRVNDLASAKLSHLTTESGALLSAHMNPDPDFRVAGNVGPSIGEVLERREGEGSQHQNFTE